MPYYALRITKPHDWIREELPKLFDPMEHYAFVCHKADDLVPREHAHVYVYADKVAENNRKAFNKRINRILNLRGNGQFATMSRDNGFEGFAFYAKHSKDKLEGNPTDEERVIYEAQAEVFKKRREEDDQAESMEDKCKPFMGLTDMNIVKVMRRFCRLNRIGIYNFDDVFVRMMETSCWRPTRMLSHPIPQPIIDEFEGGTKKCGSAWLSWINRPNRHD